MYFIKKISVDEKGVYIDSSIVSHAFSISDAYKILESVVRAYIKEKWGEQSSSSMQIIEIKDFTQVAEPIVDIALVYRLQSDPTKLYLYKRQTKEVAGIIYGKTTASTFHRIHIFDICEYDKVKDGNNEPIKKIVKCGTSNLEIPENVFKLIEQIKKSEKFIKRREIVEKCIDTGIEMKLLKNKSNEGGLIDETLKS